MINRLTERLLNTASWSTILWYDSVAQKFPRERHKTSVGKTTSSNIITYRT